MAHYIQHSAFRNACLPSFVQTVPQVMEAAANFHFLAYAGLCFLQRSDGLFRVDRSAPV